MIGRAAFVAVAFACSSPVLGAGSGDKGLDELRARDGQLFAMGWRLAAANAPYCAGTAPALGLSVLDADAFGDPDAVRQRLGLSGDLALGAVAPGSPAELAGLAANDTLLAIGETVLADAFPRRKPVWERAINVAAALDAAAAQGSVLLTVARDGVARTVSLVGVPACPSRFEVLASGGKAMAEGTRVIFGRSFVGFAYPEPEFAAAVAHEFAHNLLEHRKSLDALGRSLGNQRLTEREADRLMPWLLANAGFEPAAAVRFMTRWGPRHDGGLFRNRNHEGWDERAEAIRAEVAKVEGLMVRDGKADWRTDFIREDLQGR